MRLLKRNVTEFEYLPLESQSSDLNDDGEHTGIYHPVYGNAVQYKGNISVPSGQVQHQFYGMDIRYTHTLLMDDVKADIKESGLIRWKGHLYDIQAIRPSLNVLSIALRQQTDCEDDEDEDDEDEQDPDDDEDGGDDEFSD